MFAYLAIERPIQSVIGAMKAHVKEKTGLGAEHLVRIAIELLVHLHSSADA